MTRSKRSLLLTAAAAAALMVSLTGCSKGPTDRLQGKWVGESIDNIPPDQEPRASGWARHTSFAFEGDKMTVSLPGGESRTGTFKVERVSGHRVTLRVDRGAGEPDEATLTLLGDNSFRWDIGNDRGVKFSRATAVQ
jgi:hypothetical protein